MTRIARRREGTLADGVTYDGGAQVAHMHLLCHVWRRKVHHNTLLHAWHYILKSTLENLNEDPLDVCCQPRPGELDVDEARPSQPAHKVRINAGTRRSEHCGLRPAVAVHTCAFCSVLSTLHAHLLR